MNRLLKTLLPVALAGGFPLADEGLSSDAPNPPAVWNKVVLELTDGSRVVGKTALAALPVRISTAQTNIPLDLVHFLEFSPERRTAFICFRNNDSARGVLNLPALDLEAAYGSVPVGLSVIQKIVVLPKGERPAGLVLYFSFDQPGGEIVRDQSGFGHDGRLQGAKLIPDGRQGGALRISGNFQGVRVERHEALQLQEFTLAAWIKRSREDRVGYMSWVGNLISHGPKGFCFGLTPAAELFVSNIDDLPSGTEARITDTQFHHVAVTRRGATLVFYVDGRKAAEKLYDRTFVFNYELAIGADSPALGHSFVGVMDEVMIFNRPLAVEEIQQLVALAGAP